MFSFYLLEIKNILIKLFVMFFWSCLVFLVFFFCSKKCFAITPRLLNNEVSESLTVLTQSTGYRSNYLRCLIQKAREGDSDALVELKSSIKVDKVPKLLESVFGETASPELLQKFFSVKSEVLVTIQGYISQGIVSSSDFNSNHIEVVMLVILSSFLFNGLKKDHNFTHAVFSNEQFDVLMKCVRDASVGALLNIDSSHKLSIKGSTTVVSDTGLFPKQVDESLVKVTDILTPILESGVILKDSSYETLYVNEENSVASFRKGSIFSWALKHKKIYNANDLFSTSEDGHSVKINLKVLLDKTKILFDQIHNSLNSEKSTSPIVVTPRISTIKQYLSPDQVKKIHSDYIYSDYDAICRNALNIVSCTSYPIEFTNESHFLDSFHYLYLYNDYFFSFILFNILCISLLKILPLNVLSGFCKLAGIIFYQFVMRLVCLHADNLRKDKSFNEYPTQDFDFFPVIRGNVDEVSDAAKVFDTETPLTIAVNTDSTIQIVSQSPPSVDLLGPAVNTDSNVSNFVVGSSSSTVSSWYNDVINYVV